jgi:hypothetical protein
VKRDAQSASSLGGRKRDRAAAVACPQASGTETADKKITWTKPKAPKDALLIATLRATAYECMTMGAPDHGRLMMQAAARLNELTDGDPA